MNPDTGHVIGNLTDEERKALFGRSYKELPPELEPFAKKALGGKKETTINLKSNSRLAKWARTERANKKATRNQMAKDSRKRNRHK